MWCTQIKKNSNKVFTLATILALSSVTFASSKLTYKNARIFTDNAAGFAAKYDLVGQAKKNLDLSYFVIDSDYSSSLLAERILQKVKEARDAKQPLKVRILVDYFMSEQQLDFLRLLDLNEDVEVKRYGAPTKELLDVLAKDKLNIDAPTFISGLMAQSGTQLKKALENAKLDITPDSLKNLDLKPEDNKVYWIAKVAGQLAEILTKVKPESAEKAKALKENTTAFVKGMATFLHRTHHKLLLVDGNCYQMGGRNLSDEYHALQSSKLIQGNDKIKPLNYHFNDLDVATCLGTRIAYDKSPLVQSFNDLWNNKRTVDLSYQFTAAEKLLDTTYLKDSSKRTSADKTKEAADLAELSNKAKEAEELLAPKVPTVELTSSTPLSAVWVENTETKHEITEAYINLLNSIGPDDEVVLVNAYFFQDWLWPKQLKELEGLARLRNALIAAGNRTKEGKGRVSVYTNSIKTTDLSIVNVFAYPTYRDLANANIKLFELKEKQGELQKRSSLHMKGGYFVIDNKLVFLVGSYNLDPRSHARDTNNALVLTTPKDQALDAQAKFDAAINKGSVDPSLSKLQWNEITNSDPVIQESNLKAIEKAGDGENGENLKTRKAIMLFKHEI